MGRGRWLLKEKIKKKTITLKLFEKSQNLKEGVTKIIFKYFFELAIFNIIYIALIIGLAGM